MRVWTAIIFFSFISEGFSQNSPLRFSPQWLPQAQFAGFYVAEEQGFFREEGVAVEIVHPTANINVLDWLKQGRVDVISQFLISGVSARSQGADLVNVAQLSQSSAILFVAKKSSGIESLEDAEGKKIGVWSSGFDEVPLAMIQARELEVEWVPILSSVNLFLMDGVDLLTVMYYNEYNQLYLSGINRDELVTFFASDYGLNLPEDGLYTTLKTRLERAEELSAFVSAVRRGWEFASEHREYAVELVLERMRMANIPANPAHQMWMLETTLELQLTDTGQRSFGELKEEDFDLAVSLLNDLGLLGREKMEPGDFFLPAAEHNP